MGAILDHACGDCGYRETVAGGRTDNMCASLETMACRTCRRVVDVVILDRTDPVEVAGVRPRVLECPRSRTRVHHLVPWDRDARPCPRCGGTLEMDEESCILTD